MLTAPKHGTPLSAATALTVACLATALVVPRAALAKDYEDRDDDGRSCSNWSSAASVTQSAFPQPEVRRSSHGALETTLHACIAKNKVVDQPSQETRVIHTPTFEGTLTGPTLSVKPGDKLAIDLVNDMPANPESSARAFFPMIPTRSTFIRTGWKSRRWAFRTTSSGKWNRARRTMSRSISRPITQAVPSGTTRTSTDRPLINFSAAWLAF